jgi:hypothetical protein
VLSLSSPFEKLAQAGVEEDNGWKKHKVVHFGDIEKKGIHCGFFAERDTAVPEAGMNHLKECFPSFQKMAEKRAQIPEDEAGGRVLDEAPAGFPDQISSAKPVDENSHGKNEEDVGHLMNIKPFGGIVGLGSERRLSHAK